MHDQPRNDDWIADLETPIATLGAVVRGNDKVFEYIVSVTRRAVVRA